jgi:hypothetical protein
MVTNKRGSSLLSPFLFGFVYLLIKNHESNIIKRRVI